MKTQKLKCHECKGTGRWCSPAIRSTAGMLPAQSLQCVACGGHKFVVREIVESEDRIEHATAMSTGLVSALRPVRMGE